MHVEDVWLERDGVPLHATSVGVGDCLVVLHPLGGSAADALGWQAGLPGLRVVGCDARGHARSQPARDPAQHSWGAYAGDLLAVLDALDVPQAALCGASFGAGIALATARRAPERIAALVLIASPYAGARLGYLPEQSWLAGLGALAAQVERLGCRGMLEATHQPSPWRDAEILRWSRHDEASIVACLRGLGTTQPFDTLAELTGLTQPTLVIPGVDDTHPPSISERYLRHLPDAERADALAGGVDVPVLATLTAQFLARRLGWSPGAPPPTRVPPSGAAPGWH